MLCHSQRGRNPTGMDLRFLTAFGLTCITSVIPAKAGIQDSCNKGRQLAIQPFHSLPPSRGKGLRKGRRSR